MMIPDEFKRAEGWRRIPDSYSQPLETIMEVEPKISGE